ncbi:MAG: magnesium/cobalt transporter CorA [Vicinamibacterales bacterium]
MKSFHKAHPSAGARPGTLVIPPDAPAPRLSLTQYSAERIEERQLASLDELPAPPAGMVQWLDVRGFGDEALMRAIGERFRMTALALEDAINAPQRPKSEPYEEHHLVVSRVPLVEEGRPLSLPQVCVLIGDSYVVTFQERSFGLFDPVRQRLREGAGRPMRRSGPDYLAYALIDAMVDRYDPFAEDLTRELDAIEDSLLTEAEESTLTRLRQARRRLVMGRRIAQPQREMVTSLQADDSPFVGAEVRNYLRDTLDHIAQVAELLDASRDAAAALSEELVSMTAPKTNEVMKLLTLMASVFIPLTFIAGIYGMNFDNMPELHSQSGYFLVLAVMAVVAGGMLFYFRRRGWLGRTRTAARSGGA